MSAVAAQEQRMSDDSRLAGLESEMSHVNSGIAEIRHDVRSLTGELHAFRTEVAKQFGASRAQFDAFRVEVAEEFGGLRTEMTARFESVNTTLEQTKRWVMVSCLSALVTVLTLLAALATLGHALKWF